MTVIGLCGQSGAGKSSAADYFEAHGLTVCDCDKISREVMSKGTDCTREVISVFGDGICHNGEIDRKALGKIVFSDAEGLKTLTEITHRYIKAEVYRQLEEARKSGVEMFVIDAPLLFESGLDADCDTTLAIVANREVRVERIMARDGIDRELAEKRIDSQLDEAELCRLADNVIENNGDKKALVKAVYEFIRRLRIGI